MPADSLAGIRHKTNGPVPDKLQSSSGHCMKTKRIYQRHGRSVTVAFHYHDILMLYPARQHSIAISSSSAGSGTQNTPGTAVMAGTLAATGPGICHTPLFFALVTRFFKRLRTRKKRKKSPDQIGGFSIPVFSAVNRYTGYSRSFSVRFTKSVNPYSSYLAMIRSICICAVVQLELP